MKMHIRQRMLFFVLPIVIFSLLVLSAVTMYGMFSVRRQALEAGDRIGTATAESADAAMRDQLQKGLLQLAQENSDQVDLMMGNIKADAQLLADEMTAIASHPEAYPDRLAAGPRHLAQPELTVYLTFSSRAARSDPAFVQEIAKTANMSDFLLRIEEASPLIRSAYIASERGFMLQADEYADGVFGSPEAVEPEPFEMKERPWYQKAVQSKHVIFTDMINDYYSYDPSVVCAVPYYRNGSLAGVVGMDCFLKEAEQVVLSSQQGSNGLSFVLDQESGQILFSTRTEGELAVSQGDPVNLRLSGNPELADIAAKISAGGKDVTAIELDGNEYYVAYTPMDTVGWSFVMLLDRQEMLAPLTENRNHIEEQTASEVKDLDGRIQQIVLLLTVLGVLVLLMAVWASFALSGRLVRPLRQLNEGVRGLAANAFQGKLTVQSTGDEIESLGISFNAMTQQLQDYLAEQQRMVAEQERSQTELSVASHIQSSLLPGDFMSDRQDFALWASMHPAREVGGDFYDFYLLDDKHLMVTIADVSDKGIPAAMFMLVARTVLKNFALMMRSPDDLASVMACANDQLCKGNEEMMFVTTFLAMLDLGTGQLRYVNAGHNPPIIRHAAGQVEYLTGRHGPPLGVQEEMTYVQQEIVLGNGDLLFLYTDGVTEAMNPQKQLYGTRRLQACLEQHGGAAVADVLKAVKQDLALHVQSEPQSDDITMLGVRYLSD